MDKYVEYAPMIVVIIGFLCAYNIFVTPKQLQKELEKMEEKFENKFVLQKAYDVAIEKLEEGYNAINNKLDKIYDFLIKG